MIAALAALAAGLALPPGTLSERQMLREARELMATYGEPLWAGYSHAPFDVDLILPKHELLLCRKPEAGFSALAHDDVTDCSAQSRGRAIRADLSAANDMFADPPETIQIGTPEALGMSRGDWIATVVHERFHLFQEILPSFRSQERQRGALLGTGDGSWMLNYPFPYADIGVRDAVNAMCSDGEVFLKARSDAGRWSAIAHYVRDRAKLAASVSPKDMAYWEFQIGAEGIAKWTEIAVIGAAAASQPALAKAAKDRRRGLAVSLRSIESNGTGGGLISWRRGVFYVLGPLEADMLTQLHKDWRRMYIAKPFSFGDQLSAACPEAISKERC